MPQPEMIPTAARTALSSAAASGHSAVADFLSTISESVMSLAVLVAIWLLVRRDVPGRKPLLALMLVAYFIDFWRWLPVDPLLRVILSFSVRFPRANTGLLMCIVLGLCAALLLGACLVRRWRSRDRFVWGMVCAALVTTTTLFHLLTIHGVMRVMFAQAEQRLPQIAALAGPDLVPICAAMGYECSIRTGAIVQDDPLYQQHQTFLAPRLARRPVLPPGQLFGFSWRNPDPTAGGPYVARYQEMPDGFRVLVDRQSLVVPFGTQSVVFGGQMVLAHHIWVFGGLWILWRHRRGWRR